MKKLKFIFYLFIMMLTFSSCMAEDTEIKNRLIIEGIGIDYDSENSEYVLTVQALAVGTSGQGEEGVSSAPAVNYTVSGKTIVSALNSLCENTGKYPLYSQNRVIVIGSSLDCSEIAAALDYLVRENTARPDVYVAAATSTAAEILKIQQNGEIPAKIIEESIRECNINSLAKDTELYNVVNLYQEKTTSFTMPLLETDKDRNTDSDTVKVTGTWAQTRNGQKNHLSSEETVMFKFITDDIELGTISLAVDEKQTGLDIIRSKTKIKTELRDGNPHFTIKIKCSLDLVEYGDPNFSSITESEIGKIRQSAENYISSGIKEVINRQLKDEKCDIFRFGKYLELKYPDVYVSLSENWEEALSSFTFDVSVEATVRKIGQETLKG